ncbi:MAG: nuclear transport factor 2 family protein [Pseudomonadota bacterium]|nr:nuclear transport factor 2 family protein [Pseudomonadota bacterium]
MKKTVLALLFASVLIAPLTHAAPAAGWDAALRTVDDAYWGAYNTCDLKQLSAMNADDLEFYHDAGGVMKGRVQFDNAMAKNICGDPSNKVRREAIKDTVHAYPLMEKGVLYGAIIEGEHYFYNTAAGYPEVRAGRARFTSLYLVKDGVWKMSRVLSYDHAPVAPAVTPADSQATPVALTLLAGTYTATDKMVLTVKPAGNRLIVLAGGSTFELYPTSVNNFAMKTRPITVSFTVDAAGKGQGLVVREGGKVVAEATRSGQSAAG